ncbi:hypothetical protein ACUXST_002295 [Sphingomonas sp. F9_3S_D5_B_2]
MPEYRLYCFNEHGGISKAHEIAAEDDADAIARARAVEPKVRCELWNRDRLVAKLGASR